MGKAASAAELALGRYTVDMANHVIIKDDKGVVVGTFVVYAEWSTSQRQPLMVVAESVMAQLRKGVRAHVAAVINSIASRKGR